MAKYSVRYREIMFEKKRRKKRKRDRVLPRYGFPWGGLGNDSGEGSEGGEGGGDA